MTFFSHPHVPLSEHLNRVAKEASEALDQPALKERDFLKNLAFIAGLSHDFGKFTTFFQKYLKGKKVKNNLFHHSLISSLFAAYLGQKIFPDIPEAALILYLSVNRHHGALCLPDNTWPGSESISILKIQWEDLLANKQAIRQELKKIWDYEDLGFLDLSFENLFSKIIKNLKRTYKKLKHKIPDCEENPEELNFYQGRVALYLQLVYSALISSDKFSAAGVIRPPRWEIPSSLVDEFLKKTIKNSQKADFINFLRNRLQEDVYKKTLQENSPGIFTLTAPTGSGKTLTVFKAALKLRENLKNLWKIPPRIVYALPFINLVEQVEETLKKVLSLLPNYSKSPENFLVTHYSLSQISYKICEEELPLQESLLLIETWESEIIVTTFVQLFETLFGHANKHLKKFHNLIGAILILDEPQQFPSEYWKGIEWMLALLNEEIGVTPILMTATQPAIFRETPHKELVSQELNREFRNHVNRYSIKTLNPQEFFEVCQKELEKNQSILIVVNTIRTSLELWDYFKNLKLNRKIFYLSTNILPLHRLERINQIKDFLKSKEPILVISTQVIEAGVDLDFDVVFREICPLDSLVQAAGRCNRDNKKPKGVVYFFTLPESLTQGSRVYGKIPLEITQELWKKESVEEIETFPLVEEYFNTLIMRSSEKPSWCLWEYYSKLLFSDASGLRETLKDYPLIAPKDEVSVLVMLSPEDEENLENLYYSLFKEKDFLKRREVYLKNRKWLHERTLKILSERVLNNLPPSWKDTYFRWVPYSQLEDFYDIATGFKWRKEDLEKEVWII